MESIRVVALVVAMVAGMVGCGGGNCKVDEIQPIRTKIWEESYMVWATGGDDLYRFKCDAPSALYTAADPQLGYSRVCIHPAGYTEQLSCPSGRTLLENGNKEMVCVTF